MEVNLSLTDNQKKQFGMYLLLHILDKNPEAFPLFLPESIAPAEKKLTVMMADRLLDTGKEHFILTDEGKKSIEKMKSVMKSWFSRYNVYSYVDLEKGEFAYQYIDDFGDDEEKWELFCQSSRFDDLRIAVAEYHQDDIFEMIFFSLLAEGRYDEGSIRETWAFDLALGTLFDELQQFYEQAIHLKQLGYEDEDGVISAEAVIKDIVDQGEKMNQSLLS